MTATLMGISEAEWKRNRLSVNGKQTATKQAKTRRHGVTISDDQAIILTLDTSWETHSSLLT